MSNGGKDEIAIRRNTADSTANGQRYSFQNQYNNINLAIFSSLSYC
jgi:hypothetical protein